MNGIDYIVGGPDILHQPLPVYSDEAINFLSELSNELMRDPKCRMYPDIVSVAFWCRRSNIMRLKQEYRDSGCRIGRGLAIHITPSNIPVNFVFSYFFGLLSGNANIVRVPSRKFPQVELLSIAIKTVLERHPEVKCRTAIISYPAEDEITQTLSANADLRIIWGGDRTIERIRKFPSKPKCIDIVFADRYSICVLDGEAVLRCSDIELKQLAEAFYNDTYLMDQNACSSPQLILWMHGSQEAKERFWTGVVNKAEKAYQLQDMVAIDKYVQFCEDAVKYDEVERIISQSGGMLYRAELSHLDKTHDLRGKGGYFYEYELKSFDELFEIVNEKYQTLTYFGIDAQQIRDMIIDSRLCGIDRIVPIGSAMDIGVIWDGYDIITMLSRIVYVV